jgi:N-methylhydantoinase B
VTLDAGDVFVLDSPGGGGFGVPTRRSPEDVARDVTFGWCSQESAFRDYGVVLEVDEEGRFEVDEAGTRARRTEMAVLPAETPKGGGSKSG